MPDQLNITNLPSARVEFIDPRTGLMSREWYRFFLNLFNLTGGGNNQTSLDDLQLAPPPIPSTGGGSGTVTFVDVSGGTTGLTTTGGPVTTSGTITLGGILNVANGGTGSSTAAGAPFALKGANTDITSIALTTGTITTAPSSSNDIVNKSYADSIASGINFHAACNYATTAALPANTYNNGTSGVGATLTANANGALVVDSYTFVSPTDIGLRVLVKNEATGANNGAYTVTQVGDASNPYILTRATDYDTSGSGTNEIDQGDLFLVLSGTVNANTSWVQQTPLPITVGTTALVFIQFAAVQIYTAGTGLSLITNQFSITNIGTAGTYGSATQTPVLTTNAQGQVTGVTNTTITPAVGSITGLGTGVATFLATPSSANLAAAVTDETGSGALVFATSPTLVTPILGTPQSGVMTNVTGLPLTTGVTGTLPIANGGTGQITAAAAFNALSPITTTGDLIIGNGTNSATRLAIGLNNYVLTSNGTTASWAPATGSGATITNDTATATNVYPLFAAATSGSLTTAYTSNANLLYKPSTGEFTSSIHISSNGIQVNSKTVSTSYTIATGNSGMSAGPITIASGQTVTVSSGSRWVVL